MFVAKKLLQETQAERPDLFDDILKKIRPYSLESVLRLLDQHLQYIPDLRIFDLYRKNVPEFCRDVIMHMNFPEPGEAFGINLICRITKSDTQGTLDSKHLQSCITNSNQHEFNVEKDLLDELAIFTNHMQIFELANRHKYATIFMSSTTTIENLMEQLPRAGILERGLDFNKGRNKKGTFEYLSSFRYILVEDRSSVKVLYRSLADLYGVLRRVPLKNVVAFSDIRCVYKKCGITVAFFNTVQVAQRQLFIQDHSRYEKDVKTLLTFMFSRKELLPMNREGLARNKDRTPVDILSFEAMKRNASKMVTGDFRGVWHKTKGSSDNILFGIQPVEGTGGSFELMEKPVQGIKRKSEEKQCN